MNSKKILILGAGNAQIDAIEYCKAQGYEVTGCSYTNTDHGIPLLDHFRQVNICDVDGVVQLARESQVDLIYSIGSDLAMPTVMRASEILGLPHFISAETAMICHSKHLLREALGIGFDGNLEFITCSSLEEALAFTAFPGMMKPVDSQGQRGCFRVDSPEDIRANFEASLSYSMSKKVILEAFVDGPEVSVNAYMQDGQLKFGLVSDRITFKEYPGGIIKKHILPSHLADQKTQEAAVDLTLRIARKVGICDGPCYCQIKIDHGHPVVLEVTPRLDGCHMWRLIRHYCGADLLEASFTHLLENRSVLDGKYDYSRQPCVLEFISEKTGEIIDRSKYDFSGADYVRWYYDDGDTVARITGYVEKCGYIIRAGESADWQL